MLRCAALCCAVLRCAALCCAVLRCAAPCLRFVAPLWELQAALCASEGVATYAELGLGPLTGHPRVQALFAPHPHLVATATVPWVTTQVGGWVGGLGPSARVGWVLSLRSCDEGIQAGMGGTVCQYVCTVCLRVSARAPACVGMGGG